MNNPKIEIESGNGLFRIDMSEIAMWSSPAQWTSPGGSCNIDITFKSGAHIKLSVPAESYGDVVAQLNKAWRNE